MCRRRSEFPYRQADGPLVTAFVDLLQTGLDISRAKNLCSSTGVSMVGRDVRSGHIDPRPERHDDAQASKRLGRKYRDLCKPSHGLSPRLPS